MKLKTLFGVSLAVLTTVSAAAALKATWVTKEDFQSAGKQLIGHWKGQATLGLEVQALEGEVTIQPACDGYIVKAKFFGKDGKSVLAFTHSLQENNGKVIWNQEPAEGRQVPAFAKSDSQCFELLKQEKNGMIESLVFEVKGNRLSLTNASGWNENDLQSRFSFTGKLPRK
jgi:hypothetical protein